MKITREKLEAAHERASSTAQRAAATRKSRKTRQDAARAEVAAALRGEHESGLFEPKVKVTGSILLDLADGLVHVRLVDLSDPLAISRVRQSAKRAGAWRYGRDLAIELHGAAALTEALLRDARGAWRVDMSPAVKETVLGIGQREQEDAKAAADRIEALAAELLKRGHSLRPYQGRGIVWLAPRTAALLCDEQGLGKSCQALLAAPAGAPILTVCPAIAKGVWIDEARIWRPDLTAVELSGRGSFRWPKPGELVVTNFDILPDELPPNPPKGLVVIADEAQALQNKGSRKRPVMRTKRFRAISTLARRELGGRSWGLTGTPLQNSPKNLYTVMESFGLENVFGGWHRFTDLMAGYQDRFHQWHWGKPSPEVAALIQRVALRRERKDVAPEIPKKSWKTVRVEIGSDARKEADKALAALTKEQKVTNAQLEAAIKEAIRTKHGVAFEAISRARKSLATAKLPALVELVEQYESANEPVLVFSSHKAPVLALKDRKGWRVITGETSNDERKEIVKAFQAGELLGLAATIRSAGVALTLTHACHAIFVDLDWVPAKNQQAEDRICRIGQTRPVLITRLVADHELDQRVLEILAEKMALIEATIGAATSREGPGEVVVHQDVKPENVPQDRRKATTKHDLWVLDAMRSLAVGLLNQDDETTDDQTAQKILDAHASQGGLTEHGWNTAAKLARRWRQIVTEREPEDPSDPLRMPRSTVEAWAARAVMRLADPKRKRRSGFMGADDMDKGALWSGQIEAGKGLSGRDWKRLVVALTERYGDQVGAAPADKPLEERQTPEQCITCGNPAVCYAWDRKLRDEVLLCELHRPEHMGTDPDAVFPSRCHGGESRAITGEGKPPELLSLVCTTCGARATPIPRELERYAALVGATT